MLCSPITCLSGVSLGKPDYAAAFTETRAWDSWPCSEFTSGEPCRASCYDGSSHRKHSGARALSLKEAGTFAHYFSSTLKRAALQAIGGYQSSARPLGGPQHAAATLLFIELEYGSVSSLFSTRYRAGWACCCHRAQGFGGNDQLSVAGL